MKFVKFILIILASLVLLGLGGFAAAGLMNRESVDIPEGGAYFKIRKGEPLSSIAERLAQDRIIRSALYMRMLSKLEHTENALKTGSYKIAPGSTTSDIHDLFVAGEQTLVKVTVPEGWTVGKIGGLLESHGIAKAEEFKQVARSAAMVNELYIPGDSVEGYLFPDTYFFPEEYPPADVIRSMTKRFFDVLKEIEPDFANWKRKDIHNGVILSSIVEREYRIDEEAPYIASVFKNRIKYNIGLESCATVEYIITEIEEKPHPKFITLEDLRIDSLYNTYKWHGLPPGPISNPGRIALDATFNSAVTDYYYFVLRNPETGEHYFSSDLREHNSAKYFYLKGE